MLNLQFLHKKFVACLATYIILKISSNNKVNDDNFFHYTSAVIYIALVGQNLSDGNSEQCHRPL